MNIYRYPFFLFQQYSTVSKLIDTLPKSKEPKKILQISEDDAEGLNDFLPHASISYSSANMFSKSTGLENRYDVIYVSAPLAGIDSDSIKNSLARYLKLAPNLVILKIGSDRELIDNLKATADELKLKHNTISHGREDWRATLSLLHNLSESQPSMKPLYLKVNEYYNNNLYEKDTGDINTGRYFVLQPQGEPTLVLPSFLQPNQQDFQQFYIYKKMADLFAGQDNKLAPLDSESVMNEHTQLSAQLRNTKNRLNHCLESLDLAQLDIEYRDQQIEDLTQHAKILTEILDAHKNSFSWRVTLPMRAFLRVIKGDWSTVKRQIYDKAPLASRIFSQGLKGLAPKLWRASCVLIRNGPAAFAQQIRDHNSQLAISSDDDFDYKEWLAFYNRIDTEDTDKIKQELSQLHQPLISVVMPVFNTTEEYLRLCIESVLKQSYKNWQLCIADDASSEPHIKLVLDEYASKDLRIQINYRSKNGHISAATNSALKMMTGEYFTLLDHDDELTEHALLHIVKAVNQHPNAKIIYSDEDKIDHQGQRSDPHFKPDWNPDLLYSINYISHLGVYHRCLIDKVGGFREGLEGAQDYDFLLRCLPHVDQSEVIHVPKILYHWRAILGSTALNTNEKDYATPAGIKALENHFEEQNIAVTISQGKVPTTYRIQYPIPEPQPLVSLLIPTRDYLDVTRTCVNSILEKTTYQNFEIVILDNQSEEEATLQWFDQIQTNTKVRVIRYDHPFNYSAINNFGVEQAKGSIVGLINNDLEVISPHWLTEMVSHAVRPEIGCVGAKLYFSNDTIQHAGIILGIGGVAGHSHKYYPKDAFGYFTRLHLTQNLSAVTAACMLTRKDTFYQIGGLNENSLKVAFNDVDFCLRVREAGYRNLWTPHAELYHFESLSRGDDDTAEKKIRFARETHFMKYRWQNELQHDPAYSPWLSTIREDFSYRDIFKEAAS